MASDPRAQEAGPAEGQLKQAFETDSDLTGLLQRVLDVIVRLTRAERGFILLAHRDGTPFARVIYNMRDADLPEQDPEVSRSIVRNVLETNRPLLIKDAQHAIDFGRSGSINRLGLRSVVCAPLSAEAGCLGVIYLENRTLAGLFGEDDELRASQLAASVSRRLASYLALRNLLPR